MVRKQLLFRVTSAPDKLYDSAIRKRTLAISFTVMMCVSITVLVVGGRLIFNLGDLAIFVTVFFATVFAL